jgi:hypothetical protein
MSRWFDARGRWLGRVSPLDLAAGCLAVWLAPAVPFTASLVAGSVGLRVTGIEPDRIAVGTAPWVKVSGHDFTAESELRVGGRIIEPVRRVSETLLEAQLPATLPEGHLDIRVSHGRQTAQLTRALHVRTPEAEPVQPSRPRPGGEQSGDAEAEAPVRVALPEKQADALREHGAPVSQASVEFECMFFGLRREDVGRLRADASRDERHAAKLRITSVASHGSVERRQVRSIPWAALPKRAKLPACDGVAEAPFGTWWALATVRVSADVRQTHIGPECRYGAMVLGEGEQLKLLIRDAKLSCAVVSAPRLAEAPP